jgi:hypothetical protein
VVVVPPASVAGRADFLEATIGGAGR